MTRRSPDEELRELAEHEETITIEGEAPPVTEPLPYDLRGDEVRTLPGSGNDALEVQSLPGTARVPFGLGGLRARAARRGRGRSAVARRR